MITIQIDIKLTKEARESHFLETGNSVSVYTIPAFKLSDPEGAPYRKHFLPQASCDIYHTYTLKEGTPTDINALEAYLFWLEEVKIGMINSILDMGTGSCLWPRSKFNLSGVLSEEKIGTLNTERIERIELQKRETEERSRIAREEYEVKKRAQEEKDLAEKEARAEAMIARIGTGSIQPVRFAVDGRYSGSYVARLVGRDSQYTFEREFLKKSSLVDTEGVYLEVEVDKRGQKSKTYYILLNCPELPLREDLSTMRALVATEADCMLICKGLDEGKSLGDMVSVRFDRGSCGFKYKVK